MRATPARFAFAPCSQTFRMSNYAGSACTCVAGTTRSSPSLTRNRTASKPLMAMELSGRFPSSSSGATIARKTTSLGTRSSTTRYPNLMSLMKTSVHHSARAAHSSTVRTSDSVASSSCERCALDLVRSVCSAVRCSIQSSGSEVRAQRRCGGMRFGRCKALILQSERSNSSRSSGRTSARASPNSSTWLPLRTRWGSSPQT